MEGITDGITHQIRQTPKGWTEYRSVYISSYQLQIWFTNSDSGSRGNKLSYKLSSPMHLQEASNKLMSTSH